MLVSHWGWLEFYFLGSLDTQRGSEASALSWKEVTIRSKGTYLNICWPSYQWMTSLVCDIKTFVDCVLFHSQIIISYWLLKGEQGELWTHWLNWLHESLGNIIIYSGLWKENSMIYTNNGIRRTLFSGDQTNLVGFCWVWGSNHMRISQISQPCHLQRLPINVTC